MMSSKSVLISYKRNITHKTYIDIYFKASLCVTIGTIFGYRFIKLSGMTDRVSNDREQF